MNETFEEYNSKQKHGMPYTKKEKLYDGQFNCFYYSKQENLEVTYVSYTVFVPLQVIF